jgi:RHS repeat-associated protein
LVSSVYRFGFNGKEKDNEVKGEGNQQDYGMRVYDPRVGRFLSIDPLTKPYPELTPYQFASNRPIDAIDLDGAEASYKDPITGQMTMPSDAIRHPIPPGAYMPSNEAARGGAGNQHEELLLLLVS